MKPNSILRRQPATPEPVANVIGRARRVVSTGQYAYHREPENAERIRNLRDVGRGRALVMVGNGPSLNEAPLAELKGLGGVDTMSINKPDPRLWPTKYWSFCDLSQHTRHEDMWREYEGIVINSDSSYRVKPGAVRVDSLRGSGFSRNLSRGFHVGRSTVYANMQTAYWMGYDHVYIFGIDMNPDGLDGKYWFYGTNPDTPVNLRRDRFQLEARYYDEAATELDDAERSRYTFCSAYNPHNFVNRFNRLDHRVAVPYILERWG